MTVVEEGKTDVTALVLTGNEDGTLLVKMDAV